MSKYINIDLKEHYYVFESINIISKELSLGVNNLLKCIGSNCEGLERKHASTYKIPELKIATTGQGYVCSSGFLHCEYGILYSQLQFEKEVVENRIKSDKNSTVIYADKIVPLLRAGDHIYGHWLIDILPIVWLSKRVVNITDYKYVVRNNIPAYAIDLLSYFDIGKENLIFIDNKTQLKFENALYISNLRYNQILHPMIKDFAIDFKNKILGNNERGKLQSTGNKIYLSRAEWKKENRKKVRDLLNRKEIENYFLNKNFKVLYPEKYSFQEQVEFFSKTKLLAGEDGSALHNSIFMDAGTEIICLKGKKNHSLIQASLCSALDQKISYIIGDSDEEPCDRNSSYSINKKYLEIIFHNIP